MKDRIFKLLFTNQSIYSKTRYKLERETKNYVFLSNFIEDTFIFRVHKNTLNVKGVHKKDLYKFDVPRAVLLEEIFE